MRNTFVKDERLSRPGQIRTLFQEGKPVHAPGFHCRWLHATFPEGAPAKVLISVPKSRFPTASRRNLIKRRIREAYRKNKSILYEFLETARIQIIFSIVYAPDTVMGSREIQDKIIVLLHRLRERIEKAAG
jgi:ribonuclease P protein component